MRVFHAGIIASWAGLMLAGLLVTAAPLRAVDLSGTNPEGSTLHLTGDNTITTSYANDGSLQLDWGAATTLTNTGDFSNNGTLLNFGPVTNNGTLNNTGGWTAAAGGPVTNNGTLNNTGSLSFNDTMTNHGTLVNSCEIYAGSDLFNKSGATLINSGTLRVDMGYIWVNESSASYTGTGSVSLTYGMLRNHSTLNISTLDAWGYTAWGCDARIAGDGATVITTASVMEDYLNYTGAGAGASLSFGTLNLRGGNFNNSSALTVGITTASAGSGFTGTISGGSITLANTDVNGTLTVSSAITGSGSLTKTGTGTLVLTGTNTYAGGTVINAGRVSVGSDANLGDASGGLTFGGGTLLATGSFTSGRSVTLNSGGGAFDTNGNSLTLTGNISGDGSVIKTGSGTLTVAGTNTYAGATTINAGTLKLGAADTLPAGGAVTLADTAGAALHLNDLNQTIGSLSGGGAAGGTITLGSGTLTVGGSSATTYAGAINGTGSLVKQGTGTLALTGANTYTGATAVLGGKLSVNGTITSPVIMNGSGTLCGSGTITGNVTNSGTLAPGNSIGTLTITGDYTQNAGSTYVVEVNTAGQSDKLVVTGTATLNGGTVLVLAGSGLYKLATNYTYTILTAGSVAGKFGSVTSNLAFLTPSLSYDPTNVYLLLTRNSTDFADVAAGSNQYSVASALDRISGGSSGDMADAMNTLLGFSAPSARGAYDEMGGLTHTALTGASLFSFRGYMNVLSGRMRGFISGGPRSSFAGRPAMLASRTDTGSDAGNTLIAALANAAGNGDPSSRGLWGEGYGSLGRRRGNDISSRYDSDMAGFAAGFDRQIGLSLLIGTSLGYSHTKVDMKDLSDSATISSYQGSLYGIYKVDPFYLSGIAAYGYNRYDTKRDISFGTVSRRAKASYAGQTLGGYLEGGYRITTPSLDIIPLASLTGIYLMRDGFTERNAGALSLNAGSDTTTSLMSSLGVRLTKDYGVQSGTLTPEFRVTWDHEFMNGDYALDASFAGYPASTFTVNGDRPHRDSFGAGFSLTWQTKENVHLHFTYDGSFSGDNTQHAGTLGVRYRW